MSNGRPPQEVEVTISVTPSGTIEVDPAGDVHLAVNDRISWDCDDDGVTEWKVDFGKAGAHHGPFRDPNDRVVKGGKGERKGGKIRGDANQRGKPADPGRPDGPKGRYSYRVVVTRNGTEHELDPDIVVGPPSRT